MGVVILFVAIFGYSSFFTTDMGYNYVVQNTMTGSKTVYSDVGVHAKLPFFTNVYTYKKSLTIDFGSNDGGEESKQTRALLPTEVTFADTYNATIPYTVRFRLPTDKKSMLNLHEEFRSQDNLVDSLLTKNAKNVTVVTATQYTGEEFFQGGLNKFKVQMEDQLSNGLYQTERRQVEIEKSDLAAVSSENDDGRKIEMKKQLVWKNVVLTDKNGQVLRSENPLADFGITVSQVTINKPLPEERLFKLLEDKKALVAKRITTIQEQETAKAQAKTEQLKKEIEKTRDIQDAQRKKELAIIEKQKQVAMEQQQATLEITRKNKEKEVALIDKARELEQAQAEKEIQKANSEASKYAATAIKEKGLAQAEVEAALLKAKQSAKDVYLADKQVEMARIIYPALKDVQIQMPTYYQGGSNGNNSVPNSLDVFTTLGAMEKLKNNKTE